jgi:hypothetical protein
MKKLARLKTGLSSEQVIASRNAHGSNRLQLQEDRVFWHV